VKTNAAIAEHRDEMKEDAICALSGEECHVDFWMAGQASADER
jgi:hypothetical protein